VQLRRVLTASDATWMVAGNMIGAGIFITPGFVAGSLPGLAWPLVAWVLGGLLALAGAAIYGELGSRLPHAGGDYQYLTRAFGPMWGFLMGWSALTLSFSAAAAAMCRVSVSYLLAGLPEGAGISTAAAQSIGAPLLLLLLTWANVAGARVSGRTTAVLTGGPLLVLLVLFGYGAFAGEARLDWPAAPLAAPTAAWPLALGAAMVPVFFTFSGWNAAAYVAGELREPGRSLPRALLLGTGTVTLLYLLVNLALLALLGDGLAATATPGADALGRLLGARAQAGLSWIIAVAILGSANVTLMAGARVYYAMAVDGQAPRPLGRVNRNGVPSTALWCGGLWSALLALFAQVDALVGWATLAILLLSSLTVASLVVLRRRAPEAAPFRCPGFPFTPWLYVAASLGVATASSAREPWKALWGVLIVLAGLPVYAAWRRWK